MSEIPASLETQSVLKLKIGSEIITGFEGLQVIRSIDSGADAFAFSLPWDPTPENRKRFKPFGYQVPYIYIDDDPILTGYVEMLNFSASASGRKLEIQGRSASGLMVDTNAGPPYQFENITFNALSRELYKALDHDTNIGIAYAADEKGNIKDTKPISEVSIEPGQTMYDVLSKLAASQGLWGRPTPEGRIEFRKFTSTAKSVASLVEGQSPVKSISTNHDGTRRFQRYLVIGTSEGSPDTEAEVSDYEKLGLAKRGRKIERLAQQSTDITQAARFSRSRAVIDSYSAVAEVDGWKYNGHLWTPGEIITVRAPGAYLEKPTRLIIKIVTFTIDETGGQATQLELSLPEAFDQTDPKKEDLPWFLKE